MKEKDIDEINYLFKEKEKIKTMLQGINAEHRADELYISFALVKRTNINLYNEQIVCNVHSGLATTFIEMLEKRTMDINGRLLELGVTEIS